jgi:hypothetical protein
MIIIYNLSGLLLAGAGIVAGFFVFVLSGWLSLGLLTIAVIWFAGGLWWRNQELESGEKQPFPALFFIPLPFLAVPVAFVAALLFVVIEWGAHGRPPDPREALFKEDERLLDLGSGGDLQLSQKILAAVQAMPLDGKNAGTWHVTTRKKRDAVLVLVKATALKNYNDNTRMALVRQITDVLAADEELKEKRIFLGIKGRLTFGVVQTPPNHLQIGSAVPETKLYDFYDEPAAPARVARAGSPPRERGDSPQNVSGEDTASGAALADADATAEPFPHEVAKRVENDRPDSEPDPGEPEAGAAPEDDASPGATEDRPAARAPPADKPPPRATPRERAPTDTARRSADREARRDELKKRSDERMAELRKRSEERRAEAKKRSNERTMDPKKRSDERLAASLLNNADIFRKVGNLVTYRKRLQEIVDKYPETEAGKKAAELLE